MTLRISKRLDGVSESATLRLNARVQELKAAGEPVINLTTGEPDFAVPDEAKEAVTRALAENKSKYTHVAGVPELRTLVAEKTNAQQPSVAKSRPWKAADVIVSNGGKHALFNAFLALIDSGDEVLIPAPYWLSYPEMAKLAGGVPRIIEAPLSQGFKITPEQLKRAIGESKRPRILIINSPSNPTGAMYTRAELAKLGEVVSAANAPDLWVISDEIYDRITFGPEPFCSFLEAAPQLRDRTVTVNGMSKSAAMTGWRIGWTVARTELTQAMSTIQGQCTSNVNALAQWASVAALKLPESAFTHQVDSYRKRRDQVLEILGKAGKIKLFRPQGAFYAFLGVGDYFKPGEDSMGFAERLLEGAKVAVVPGTPFGDPRSIRISVATDESTLREACERIVRYLQQA